MELLPIEIFKEIFEYLSITNLTLCKQLCKKTYSILHNNIYIFKDDMSVSLSRINLAFTYGMYFGYEDIRPVLKSNFNSINLLDNYVLEINDHVELLKAHGPKYLNYVKDTAPDIYKEYKYLKLVNYKYYNVKYLLKVCSKKRYLKDALQYLSEKEDADSMNHLFQLFKPIINSKSFKKHYFADERNLTVFNFDVFTTNGCEIPKYICFKCIKVWKIPETEWFVDNELVLVNNAQLIHTILEIKDQRFLDLFYSNKINKFLPTVLAYIKNNYNYKSSILTYVNPESCLNIIKWYHENYTIEANLKEHIIHNLFECNKKPDKFLEWIKISEPSFIETRIEGLFLETCMTHGNIYVLDWIAKNLNIFPYLAEKFDYILPEITKDTLLLECVRYNYYEEGPNLILFKNCIENDISVSTIETIVDTSGINDCVFENIENGKYYYGLICVAYNNLDYLNLIYRNVSLRPNYRLLKKAIKMKNEKMLEWCLVKDMLKYYPDYHEEDKNNIFVLAANNNNLKLLKLLRDQDYVHTSEKVLFGTTVNYETKLWILKHYNFSRR